MKNQSFASAAAALKEDPEVEEEKRMKESAITNPFKTNEDLYRELNLHH